MTEDTTHSSLSRRQLLAGATASVAATAGCVDSFRNRIGLSQQSQLSLEITTQYADLDPFSIRIAQQLRTNLEAVGIDTELNIVDVSNFSRQVLLNHDFDIYVGQFPYPQPPDPDVLYSLFRSTFEAELGWQNPFGFTHLTCDDLLDSQRSTGGARRKQAVDSLQRLVARTQPLVPLVFPERLTGVRTDSFVADSWDQTAPTQPHNLLKLTPVDDPGTLSLAVVDDRITTNRNPISADYKQGESLIDLLYDPLALKEGDEYLPWLAREYRWLDTEGPPEVSITLREELQWHDGEQLTAFDVDFTYEFLRDTSLGSAVRPIPSERFRGRVSLVDEIQVKNSRELRITFTETTQRVAERALTVPMLPAHIWRYRTRVTRPRNRAGQTTVALTTANQAAVGSGPIQFDQAVGDDLVEFSRFDQHFLWRLRTPTDEDADTEASEATEIETNESVTNQSVTNQSTTQPNSTAVTTETGTLGEDEDESSAPSPQERFDPPPAAYDGPLPFESVVVESVGSDNAAIELLINSGYDATMATLWPTRLTPIETDPDLEVLKHRSNAFYHLGFNTRRQPLRNPNMRRLIAQLVDKPTLVEKSFNGYGEPIASPLAGTEWLVDSLQWNDSGRDPEVPFIGTDGELDVDRARERLRDIGYQYTADNELISQIK